MSKKLSTITSESIDNSQEYLKNSWEYYKLKLFLHTAEFSTTIIKYGILSIFGLIALLLFSLALSIYLGNLTESMSLGFLIVGAIYLVFLLLVLVLKNPLETKIIESLSKSILHDE